MSDIQKVVIIIPTYNEVDVIAETIHALQAHVNNLPHVETHILVFDSHSLDGTVEQVQQLQSSYHNLHFSSEPSKTGLGGAYIKAMQYAMDEMQADIVVEYDADGSHQPQLIPPMLALLHQGYDVVMGSRYIPGGGIQDDWAWYRKALSAGGNWIARLFLTNKYKDFTSGFRITRTSFLKKIDLTKLLSKQYAYKIHLLWWLHKQGANIVEYPIMFIDRKQGYSKFPRNNVIDSLRVVITLRLREMQRYIKVCMVGFVGMSIQFVIFNLFRYYLNATWSNAVAIECAIISNFIINNNFTFKDRRFYVENKLKFFGKFLKFNSFSMVSMVLQVIITYIFSSLFSLSAIEENAVVFFGICIGSVVNYFIYSRLIWKQTR